ncbi:MAG: hypothetical protein E7Z92_03635 [Cyanobacteria bacterium SIG31]|nr:hypothetical protein [Cyanobacteria bacterium SIG31]
MGMDGLSMSNTGALKEPTSADHASRTEQVIHSDATNDPKMVQTLSTNRRVKEKEDDEESSKQKQQEKQEEDIEDSYIESEPEFQEEEFHIEDLENPNKDFYVKLNAKDDIIELYDSATDRLIETISGGELRELVKKLNMASGIFVNKKV